MMYTDDAATTCDSCCAADQQATVATIHAMLRQEETGYSLSDDAVVVRADCRLAMARWFQGIAQHCRFSNETVEIALSCLDRFTSTPTGRKEIRGNRKRYQLAAMTALYASVKVHEPEVMDLAFVSKLSRNAFSPKDIESMEYKMLTAIRWRVNPPTTASFARSMIHLVPDDRLSLHEKEALLEIAVSQIETVVVEHDFGASVRASSIALACALNAAESFLGNDDDLSAELVGALGTAMTFDVDDLRTRIWDLLNGNDAGAVAATTAKSRKASSSAADSVPAKEKKDSIHSSPRTVATTSLGR